ncbi:MAG: primosomal protein N' [Candidatus Babeliales bacterium]
MFIQVRLLKGFSEYLWYCVPSDLIAKMVVGNIVKVPLRNQVLPAIVEKITKEKPLVKFAIKNVQQVEEFPQDIQFHAFIKKVAWYYQIDVLYFFKRIRQFLLQKEANEKKIIDIKLQEQPADIQLTDEQQKIVDFLRPHIKQAAYTPALIHGVTGSGKTEVYKKCIEKAFESGKTTILLLPEVTLAVQFIKKLTQQINPSIPIFGFHSATSIKEKRLLWKKLLTGKPILIIGVHLPILLPISNLGLIIIDEEHDAGFQEKKHPRINSKEVALLRAQLYNIPIIMGSATPSVTSLYNVKAKQWHFFQLKKRFAGSFPKIQLVKLTESRKRPCFWVTWELEKALRKQLEKKEQTILFLNRRGFSFFVQCHGCSLIMLCEHCSVSLTLHQNNQLLCHYCGIEFRLPTHCPSCKKDQWLKKGIGTQQLVALLEKLIPEARIGRADLDTTINKKKWQETMQEFEDGQIDILVGTQTITKGYHFPKVTLVGIIWADLNIHFPFYNASEIALQQLIQVAGRAGRQSNESLVIVQTMADHHLFSYLSEIDYLSFYERELKTRKEVGYPPAMRLAEIELKFSDEEYVVKDARDLVTFLQKAVNEKKYSIKILGPALPPVHKIKNTHARKIYLKSASISELLQLYASIDHRIYKSNIFFTPNP